MYLTPQPQDGCLTHACTLGAWAHHLPAATAVCDGRWIVSILAHPQMLMDFVPERWSTVLCPGYPSSYTHPDP